MTAKVSVRYVTKPETATKIQIEKFKVTIFLRSVPGGPRNQMHGELWSIYVARGYDACFIRTE